MTEHHAVQQTESLRDFSNLRVGDLIDLRHVPEELDPER